MPKSDKIDEVPGRTLGLLLIDGFALMSYASVIEPFRAANTLAGRELYRWTHISVDGREVRASNGASLLADHAVGEPIACDTLFVFAGGDPAGFSDAKTFAWLRQLALSNVRLAGVSGGPFLLARAGVLAGYRATIHWDHQAAFLEAFPTLAIEPGLYVIDRRRLTCAGGTAGLDLAIELIEREHGHKLAAQVSEWFIRTEPRPAAKSQRLSLRERVGISNDRVLRVLAEMEGTLEQPSGMQDLAKLAGVSLRQLERLFSTHLHETVTERYLRIRLEKAAELLRKTGLSVTEVGVACGFQSSSHFSRAFKARYGKTPSSDRRHGQA
jgi:transcriptional regulator GlxA family with amidase domain